MTGFGKATCELKDKIITIELRSLNSKQLDMSVRIPQLYREKEFDIRNEFSKVIERGKADALILVEYTSEAKTSRIDKGLAKNYYKEMKELALELNDSSNDLLATIMRLPDILKPDKQEVGEEEWKALFSNINKACKLFSDFRISEGKSLETELINRITKIAEGLAIVAEQDGKRLEQIKSRIKNNIVETIGLEKVDENRFEQELIYYMEKIDITEEKVRLKTHCDYFLKTLKDPSNGRKLGFISQEIGREINTIGSKANDAAIQKVVVEMKDELEKVKEQLLNVL